MEKVPVEVQKQILCQLDTESVLNAALSCRGWLRLLLPVLPDLKHLNISLDASSCNAHISYRTDHDNSAAVCQCSAHASSQAMLLRQLLAQFGEGLRSVQIEDNLLNRCSEECIRDYPFHVILRQCNVHNLQQISLHCVDLSSVRIWTLSSLAMYSALNSICFEECKFPAELNESLFLRMLAPSFTAIQLLRITNNSLVTDKFGIQVAKRCARLSELSLRGCPKITALTVVAFCEHLANLGEEELAERPLPMSLDLRGTAFDSMEFARQLHSPLLRCNPASWLIQPITLNIGFDRKALLLAEKERIGGVAITLFID